MLNQNEKLERFSAQINRTAEKSVQKIVKQTEKISNTQLEQFRAESQAELEERMAYAEGRLQRDANAAVARQAAARKKQASVHRGQIVDEVFDRAKTNILSFRETQDYQPLLRACIETLMQSLGKPGAKVFVCASDVDAAKAIVQSVDPTAAVLADSENALGLAKVESADGTVRLNDTFQSRLLAARAQFLTDCGLSILPREGD